MKPQHHNSIRKAVGVLCVLAMSVLPACQKAKMTSVPRSAPPAPVNPGSQPPVTPHTPPPTTGTPPPTVTPPPPPPITGSQPPPVPNPPVVTPPNTGGSGEGGIEVEPRPEPTPPVIVYDTPPQVITPPQVPPIVAQPPVEIRRDVRITWFDTEQRPHNILPVCHNNQCPPPECTHNNCGDVVIEPEPEPEPPQEYQCDPITQRVRPITNKLDVLFMVDTSASLYAEYQSIASNIASFVNALPRETDFRFAMMIGHGPEAQVDGQNWYGKFWAYGQSDQTVINAGRLLEEDGGLSVEGVASWLWQKFKGGPTRDRIPHDRTSAQGEALLSNLNEFLRNPEKFNQNAQNQVAESLVFPRRDAALAVIIISDENDVCYDYAEANVLRQAQGLSILSPNFADRDNGIRGDDGILRDRPEHLAYNSDLICKYQGHRVDYDMVAQALRHYYPLNAEGSNNMPLIVSGILYRTNSEIPNYSDRYAGDNEAAWGHLELIQALGGEAVSLADDDFGQDLAQIGDLSRFRMQYENVVPLQSDGQRLDLRSIDIASLRVEIHKPDGQVLNVDRAHTDIEITEYDEAGTPLHGNLVIRRAALEELIGPGDQVRVFYRLPQ